MFTWRTSCLDTYVFINIEVILSTIFWNMLCSNICGRYKSQGWYYRKKCQSLINSIIVDVINAMSELFYCIYLWQLRWLKSILLEFALSPLDISSKICKTWIRQVRVISVVVHLIWPHTSWVLRFIMCLSCSRFM